MRLGNHDPSQACVVISFPLGNGKIDTYELLDFEPKLKEALHKSGNIFDGYGYGDVEIDYYTYGKDFNNLYQTVLGTLSQAPYLKGITKLKFRKDSSKLDLEEILY